MLGLPPNAQHMLDAIRDGIEDVTDLPVSNV
jgi:hypothetical protein